ncbi:MAG TPA: FISUMP domain-containing protein [Luteitalea sp.]|nr:FISUMP domain-containing protein [Luteitalea sp.]
MNAVARLLVAAVPTVMLYGDTVVQGTTPASRVMADGHTWTTRNVDVTIDGSYCYGDDKSFCDMYGRLYTWAAAPKACQTLGAGWRLPTVDEWMRLAQAYGGGTAEDGRLGSAAYDALLTGGRSGFEAVLGGGREDGGGYARADAHGFYWSSTESLPQTAMFMNFGKGSRGLYRQRDGEKGRAFSVRCIR